MKPLFQSDRDAINQAVESLRTEGFNPDSEDLARFERLAAGHITTPEARQELLNDLVQKQEEFPELFEPWR